MRTVINCIKNSTKVAISFCMLLLLQAKAFGYAKAILDLKFERELSQIDCQQGLEKCLQSNDILLRVAQGNITASTTVESTKNEFVSIQRLFEMAMLKYLQLHPKAHGVLFIHTTNPCTPLWVSDNDFNEIDDQEMIKNWETRKETLVSLSKLKNTSVNLMYYNYLPENDHRLIKYKELLVHNKGLRYVRGTGEHRKKFSTGAIYIVTNGSKEVTFNITSQQFHSRTEGERWVINYGPSKNISRAVRQKIKFINENQLSKK